MKISELISQLTEIQDTLGDLTVYTNSLDGNYTKIKGCELYTNMIKGYNLNTSDPPVITGTVVITPPLMTLPRK